jgi:hypothetical protein
VSDKQLWHLMSFIKACTDRICWAIALGEDFNPSEDFDFPKELLQAHKRKIWKE